MPTPAGRLTELGGERVYEISDAVGLPPFLICLASPSDHWMFVSSAGALTAGRRSADEALFPYTTDDRLHDDGEKTGPKTILRVGGGVFGSESGAAPWEPFSIRQDGLYRVSRRLCKSVWANKLWFEETNHDLGLTFSYAWMNSERFGFVRRAWLHNRGERPLDIELLDGVQNLMPAGLGRRFQMEYSPLADAYKESELDGPLGLALFRLASIPIDASEPSESLRATAVWSTGLERSGFLLSSRQLEAFRRAQPLFPETHGRGCRGAYFQMASLSLAPGQTRDWYLVADVGLDAAEVVALGAELQAGRVSGAELERDIARGTESLIRVVAQADGLQSSADELSTIRHFSNVLFNCMRGGRPEGGYTVGKRDIQRFFAATSPRVAAKHRGFLEALAPSLRHADFLDAARLENDPDLERLSHEYLPLGFGRRHGDPSRPWNIFNIRLKDAAGEPVLDYQGNWRDIFQNWEALAWSYPGYALSMVFKFLDASTADGYNPYRLTRDGFEWEVLDPHDAWSFIGYWGDHQVIYLLKLLEICERFWPGRLEALLYRRVFSYANLPYRIKPHEAQVQDPQDTIVFDAAAHEVTMARTRTRGTEGKLLAGPDGSPCRANLGEKLLVLLLARLASFVPEAGLWLNTQRPEWNDANNALVGNGASVVTVCYLRRFLCFLAGLLPKEAGAGCEVAVELVPAFRGILAALCEGAPARFDDRQRRVFLDAVACPFSAYRTGLYTEGLSGATTTLAWAEVQALLTAALRLVDHTIAANRREDGLYHAYNLIAFSAEGIKVRRLYEMLEGQVAVLSSGALSAEQALGVLDALRDSALYRRDRGSYLLYPDRKLPGFLQKNRVPAERVRRSRLLSALLAAGDRSLVLCDVQGGFHFAAELRNAKVLEQVLDGHLQGPLAELVRAERPAIRELYEEVFDHRSFTGRSGTFFKYEGLGCIYWHMVSKLAVAVQEVVAAAQRAGAKEQILTGLLGHYWAIREGIGVHLPPAVYGAFPIDPYSHSPAFLGAQQPGMTGQVKEDILTRWGEVGIQVEDGRIALHPDFIRPQELAEQGAAFRFVDLEGETQELLLPAQSFAFTLCQVPFVVHRAGPPRMVAIRHAGGDHTVLGLSLDRNTSQHIFERSGVVARVDVYLGAP